MQSPSPDDQPTIRTAPPNGSRPASQPGMWQAPSVEEMQAMLLQYEVIEILGRGGMGAVYKGRQKSLKRLVAIKILPLGMADDEMKFAERFQNEAQTMAAMNHPAIVSVYDFGETSDGLLYFVMEFVDGTDVQKMIQASGKLSGDYALAITAHVCDALSYAHKRGVIHRDIKPANILIDQEGHIKVADFGLAKMSDPAMTSGLTKTNMAMGTPDYVAPEVLSPGMVADHRADLYAVGVMLYQMLTGEVPRGMFKLPSQKGIGSDPRFDEIICKAMEQDREERYQSAMEVRRALDVILTTPQPKDDGTGVVAAKDIPQKPVAKLPRPPPQQKSEAGTPARSQQPAKQGNAESIRAGHRPALPGKKSSATTTWLSIGGIVVVLGVAAFFLFGGKPKPQLSDTADISLAPASSATPQPPIKVRENQKPAAPAPSASAKENTIDLLPLVDVKRYAIAGEWSREGGDLLVKAAKPDAKGTPRLQLPYQPPEEYDFEIEFTPESGTNMVGQVLSAYQRSFAWFLDAKVNTGSKAGFDALDGVSVARRADGTAMRPKSFLNNGQRHRSTVEVRRTGMRGLLDGEVLVSWGSKPSSYDRFDISKNEQLRDALHLGLASYDRAVRFHKLTVREVSGAGKVDATAPASASAKENTIDWLKAVPSEGKPWTAEWGGFKDGVLTPTTKFTRLLGTLKDGSVRMRVRRAPGSDASKHAMLAVEIRNSPMPDKATGFGQYQFQVFVPKRTCSFNFEEKIARGVPGKIEYLWRGDPSVGDDSSSDGIEWEFRAAGDEFSAWADGKLIQSIRDARVPAGFCTITADAGMQITRLETSGITPNKTTEAKPDAPPNITNWQDVTATLREKARAIQGAVVEDGGVHLAEGSSPQRVMLTPPGVSRFAMRVRYTGGTQVDRVKEGSGFDFVICQKAQVGFKRVTNGNVSDDLAPWGPHPAGYDSNVPHDLLVTMNGAQIRAWVDGHFMGEARDEVITEGEGWLMLKGYTTIHKVEIAELPIVADVADAPAPSPNITNWQDLTETVRERARKLPELVVEPCAVRRVKPGPVSISLTTQPVRDCAVRVRYTGEVEIDLRHKADGFDYVLATSQKSVFMRYRAGVTEPAMLIPVVPHPAGFVSGKPHEFIVTIQGALIRAWLDGGFVGEVQDNTFAEGNLRVTWLGASSVQKIEIAELAAGKVSATGANGGGLRNNVRTTPEWTDWLGPKLASGQSPLGEWTMEKDGVTTEKVMGGTNVVAQNVRAAAVRVSYDLRDSKGIQITMRENNPGGSRDMYFVDDTGDRLYIARLQGSAVKTLAFHDYPAGTPRSGARTMEFRCVGERLDATVTGATSEPITISVMDAALTSGPCGVVLKKGVLLKKVETMQIED